VNEEIFVDDIDEDDLFPGNKDKNAKKKVDQFLTSSEDVIAAS